MSLEDCEVIQKIVVEAEKAWHEHAQNKKVLQAITLIGMTYTEFSCMRAGWILRYIKDKAEMGDNS
jgi:hypothetical protein